MSKPSKLIQDLILFYVQENYNHYLKKIKLKKIREEGIGVVLEFLKTSLKEIMGDDYIGDLALLNICNEIFEDETLCVNRLILEIKNYQNDN